MMFLKNPEEIREEAPEEPPLGLGRGFAPLHWDWPVDLPGPGPQGDECHTKSLRLGWPASSRAAGGDVHRQYGPDSRAAVTRWRAHASATV